MTPWEVLQLPFARHALLAALLVGGLGGWLGVFVVLRRIVFVGIVLAQLAALGVALSFHIRAVPAELLALACTLGGALLLSRPLGGRWLPREATIAFLYAASTAAATLLVARSAQGESHLLGLLFGNILTLDGGEVARLAAVAAGVALLHGIFHKEFLFTSFDPVTARSAGYRVAAWDLLFDLSLAVAIAMSIHAAGALLVFSCLVQPAMVGLLLAKGMRGVSSWAVGSGLFAAAAGVWLSIQFDLPSGPCIVATSSALVLLALALRPRLGRE